MLVRKDLELAENPKRVADLADASVQSFNKPNDALKVANDFVNKATGTILNFKPEGKGTNLSLPLEYLLNIQKRKTTAFLISDFQDDNYEATLKLAKQKHDLVAISITDQREEA